MSAATAAGAGSGGRTGTAFNSSAPDGLVGEDIPLVGELQAPHGGVRLGSVLLLHISHLLPENSGDD